MASPFVSRTFLFSLHWCPPCFCSLHENFVIPHTNDLAFPMVSLHGIRFPLIYSPTPILLCLRILCFEVNNDSKTCTTSLTVLLRTVFLNRYVLMISTSAAAPKALRTRIVGLRTTGGGGRGTPSILPPRRGYIPHPTPHIQRRYRHPDLFPRLHICIYPMIPCDDYTMVHSLLYTPRVRTNQCRQYIYNITMWTARKDPTRKIN